MAQTPIIVNNESREKAMPDECTRLLAKKAFQHMRDVAASEEEMSLEKINAIIDEVRATKKRRSNSMNECLSLFIPK
jgi:3-dehydroquinate synthetase